MKTDQDQINGQEGFWISNILCFVLSKKRRQWDHRNETIGQTSILNGFSDKRAEDILIVNQ